jgi:NAD(P)-dependent dehydrogenase (short-subunit alcohol dehydrogenase family)
MAENIPAQSQDYPGSTAAMVPAPRDEMRSYVGRGLFLDRVALITGGDSGIGRAVAIAYAKEGADVAIAYLDEADDAEHTAKLVQAEGRRCLLLPGDLAEEKHCVDVVEQTVLQFGRLDIVVNHAGTQAPAESLEEISTEQWNRTWAVNVSAMFWVTRAALHHLPPGGAIINTGSVNGLRGNKTLIDYATTKGAVHILTKSLAQSLLDRNIRVNCVAPGPVWTPLIPATFPAERVAGFGGQAPAGRAAEPDEIAPAYVFLASNELSSYITGEVISQTGGEVHPG